ncbi:MAG TPA: type II secretion system protein [Candidatus Acidoferrales bacterium]|jgi:hypothetical protein|nr:type II secretion system protein [Candidatus Acidoferrales bacterium]
MNSAWPDNSPAPAVASPPPRSSRAFTVIELLFIVTFVVFAAALLVWIFSQKLAAESRLADARLYAMGLTLYANDHHGEYPTNLSQTLPYVQATKAVPGGTNGFELLFHGSATDLTNAIASRVIVLRGDSIEDRDGKWIRVYGFADGHSEAHIEPENNFADWERQHSVALNQNR